MSELPSVSAGDIIQLSICYRQQVAAVH